MSAMGRRCRGAPRCGRLLQTLLLTVWLSLWIQQSSAQGSGADVVTATVGETVTLTGLFVNATIHSFVWYTGPGVGNTQQIFSYVVSTSLQINGPQFSGRETGLPDGSMQIRDVLTNYTANYTVNVVLSNGSPSTVIRQLVVYERIDTEHGGGPGLSGGAVAGIVIGGFLLVCVVVYILIKKLVSGRDPENSADQERGYERVPTSPQANGIQGLESSADPAQGYEGVPTSPQANGVEKPTGSEMCTDPTPQHSAPSETTGRLHTRLPLD